jgi:hypothetical protein
MPVLTLSSSIYSSLAQEKFPVREWTFSLPFLTEHISFNPLVSGIGVSMLWGLAIWSIMVSLRLGSFLFVFRTTMDRRSRLECLQVATGSSGLPLLYVRSTAHFFLHYPFFKRQQDPEGSNETLVDWRGNVTLYFTWLFIGSRAIFFLFIVFIGFRFSHVKLGHKDEEPEFSTAAFFSMIFA